MVMVFWLISVQFPVVELLCQILDHVRMLLLLLDSTVYQKEHTGYTIMLGILRVGG